MFPSSPIPAWVDTLGQWLKAQRQTMSGLTKPDTKGSAHLSADCSAIIHYEGFHGTPSRCHVVHRRLDDRILFGFGGIEDGGTSPTNTIEELAVAMWKRGRAPRGGVGAVGKSPACLTGDESSAGGRLIHSGGHRGGAG